ncbi:uncharacterized protein [Macrobrachium rosenbergii]|uniref:uncharacterized protein isoform X3 n=1 Tax=Macrobrachium rosenbergii TaxID=79674 RepID=UPI0034D4297C
MEGLDKRSPTIAMGPRGKDSRGERVVSRRPPSHHVVGVAVGSLSALAVSLVFLLFVSHAGACRSGPRIRWRSDGRCGSNFPLASKAPSECDPDSDRPCCSDYGYCGNSLSHCTCPDCIDFRSVIREPSCYYSFENEAGLLESPNFPNQYPPGRDCCYDIVRPSRRHCGVKVDSNLPGRRERRGRGLLPKGLVDASLLRTRDGHENMWQQYRASLPVPVSTRSLCDKVRLPRWREERGT